MVLFVVCYLYQFLCYIHPFVSANKTISSAKASVCPPSEKELFSRLRYVLTLFYLSIRLCNFSYFLILEFRAGFNSDCTVPAWRLLFF